MLIVLLQWSSSGGNQPQSWHTTSVHALSMYMHRSRQCGVLVVFIADMYRFISTYATSFRGHSLGKDKLRT